MLKDHHITLTIPTCVTTRATTPVEPEVNGSSSPSAPMQNQVCYHWLVPGQLLFVKLPACVALIDPDSQAVAEIVMAPAPTTVRTPAPTGSQPR